MEKKRRNPRAKVKYKVQEQRIENEKSEEEVTQWSADFKEGIAKTVTASEVITRAVAKFRDEAENCTRYLQDKEEEKRALLHFRTPLGLGLGLR